MSGTDIASTSSPMPNTEQQTNKAYEQMCTALYAYRYGAIGFLDLIERFEKVLGITPPQPKPQQMGGNDSVPTIS